MMTGVGEEEISMALADMCISLMASELNKAIAEAGIGDIADIMKGTEATDKMLASACLVLTANHADASTGCSRGWDIMARKGLISWKSVPRNIGKMPKERTAMIIMLAEGLTADRIGWEIPFMVEHSMSLARLIFGELGYEQLGDMAEGLHKMKKAGMTPRTWAKFSHVCSARNPMQASDKDLLNAGMRQRLEQASEEIFSIAEAGRASSSDALPIGLKARARALLQKSAKDPEKMGAILIQRMEKLFSDEKMDEFERATSADLSSFIYSQLACGFDLVQVAGSISHMMEENIKRGKDDVISFMERR